MKGTMFLESEFNKGTSTSFFVPLIKVKPDLANQINSRNLMISEHSYDSYENEIASCEVNQTEFEIKHDAIKYKFPLSQSASQMKFE